MRGKFISFEGCEGSGKSSQSRLLHEHLVRNNMPAIHTREIGGSSLAEHIRDIVLHQEMTNMSELLLVMAARHDHLTTKIVPALKEGKHVICDRFIDSSICYQSEEKSNGLNEERIFQLHSQTMPGLDSDIGLLPDKTVFLSLPVDKSLARARSRGGNNKFEDKAISYHQKIHQRFLKLAEKHQNRIIKIESDNMTQDEINQLIIQKINL